MQITQRIGTLTFSCLCRQLNFCKIIWNLDSFLCDTCSRFWRCSWALQRMDRVLGFAMSLLLGKLFSVLCIKMSPLSGCKESVSWWGGRSFAKFQMLGFCRHRSLIELFYLWSTRNRYSWSWCFHRALECLIVFIWLNHEYLLNFSKNSLEYHSLFLLKL